MHLVYVEGCNVTASYRRELPLSAPLESGSSFAADTDDGSITLENVRADSATVRTVDGTIR